MTRKDIAATIAAYSVAEPQPEAQGETADQRRARVAFNRLIDLAKEAKRLTTANRNLRRRLRAKHQR